MADVSPSRGHGSLASRGVTAAPVPSSTSSRPILYSLFRGPFAMNMAETEEEKKAREDEEKKSNFKKVQEAREAEKARADAAEAERDQLRKEKADRDAKDKKASEEKLAADGNLQALADAKAKEAADNAASAAAEKARADAAEAKVKAYDDQQEADLEALLKTIPKEKQPPLDAADPVSKRLAQAKHVASLLATGPKPQVGGGAVKGSPQAADRKAELYKKGLNRLTPDESMELMELDNA